ncbi:MAG: matrixin family metalloprotease [Myxococcales bacterium]|nr:matrixin family metalloprotease [Myxococcales bacterium]
MGRPTPGIALLVVLLLLSACGGYKPSPYAQRRAYQERAAQRMRAVDAAPRQRSWRAFTPMPVRVHVGPAYRQRNAEWRMRIEDQIERANAVLKESLGIELEVLSVEPWERRAPLQDLSAQLDELVKHDEGRDAEWVLGLVGSMPRASNSFTELGMARVLGKHLVMRDMDDHHERQLIGQLDTLDDEDQRDLYRGRKRHKEMAILLHEIGHTLGAMHVSSPVAMMCPGYSNRMRIFADGNLTLMRKVLQFRAEPKETRDVRELIASLSSFVQSNPQAGWVMAERAEYVRRLELAHHEIDRAVQQLEREAAVEQTTPPDGPEWDVSALPEADRARFADARRASDEGDFKTAYETASALADAHRNSYATQQLACQLAMHTGRPMKQVRRYCDRMSELAQQQP